MLGELAFTSEDYQRAHVISEINNAAWVLAGSYFLTGEDNSDKTVKIRRPFHPAQDSWGALEIKARYGGIWVNKDAFISLANSTTSAQRADDISLGLNWHLNQHIKWMLDYEQTDFNGGSATGDREDERAMLPRLQLSYETWRIIRHAEE